MKQENVTYWISQLAKQDVDAAEQLWQHFSARMHNLARRQLDPLTRRTYDEQDAANSAFHSFCQGMSNGRFEHVANRDSLWGLLAVITARKVSSQRRSEHRQKRGGGQVRGDSVFAEFGLNGINEVAGSEPTPEFAAAVTETCDRLFNAIDDPMHRKIVLLKFEGFTNGEIALKLECTRRTIERKLELIRRTWVVAKLVQTESETPEASDQSPQTENPDDAEKFSEVVSDARQR